MTSQPVGSLGLGVDAGLAPPVARALAERAAELGYESLWSNDEPTAPGLETLAEFARGAPQLEVGVGVLPLDRFPPDRIASDIERLGLDVSKLWIGIGSGRLPRRSGPCATPSVSCAPACPGRGSWSEACARRCAGWAGSWPTAC